MPPSETPPKRLPEKPSEEFLRKEAKRLAREQEIQLAAAQHQLAQDYGYRNWTELIKAVEDLSQRGTAAPGPSDPSPPSAEAPADQEAPSVFPFLPLLPLRELIAFPHVVYPIYAGRPMSIAAVTFAEERKSPILLTAQKNSMVRTPSGGDLYETGTLAAVLQLAHLSDGTVKAVLEGKKRARVSRFVFDEEFFKAEAEEIIEPSVTDAGLEALIKSVVSAFVRTRIKSTPADFARAMAKGEESASQAAAFLGESVTTTDPPSIIADRIVSHLPMKLAEKQALLETLNPVERLKKILAHLNEPQIAST
jgi:ATP-dependent Lon protease